MPIAHASLISGSTELRADQEKAAVRDSKRRGRQSFLNGEIHSWYRLVLGYSDHAVSFLIDRLGVREDHTVLDPFCGAGTTLVECLKRNVSCVGIDANPSSCFAARVKTDWSLSGKTLTKHVDALRKLSRNHLRKKSSLRADQTYRYLEESGMIARGWISIAHLERAIAIKLAIAELSTHDRYREALTLALLGEVVYGASNVRFGPELYCGPEKPDRDVFGAFADRVRSMGADLQLAPEISVGAKVIQGDARDLAKALSSIRPARFNAVISSPPYPNEHDYTRNARLELAFLELVVNPASVRAIKRGMIRCHTKGIYVDDSDAPEVARYPAIQILARRIQKRAAAKTHCFAPLYPAVIRQYFGGMKRHLVSLWPRLVPGAKCAYVVGDQAGYLRVHIRTADILATIAKRVGYKVIDVVQWREAFLSASRPRHENILIIQKPKKPR
jgi:DNA methylase